MSIFAFCTSLTPQHSATPVSGHQTEEWKELYSAIPVFIASYVWMTGLGDFSFYLYSQKEYVHSVRRFLQVTWRFNFFVSLCCLKVFNYAKRLSSVLPSNTFVYRSCAQTIYRAHLLLAGAWNEKNDNTVVLLQKLAVCASLVYVTWEIPGVFHACFRPNTFLLKYTNPERQVDDPLRECFFSSGLDR
eukprot:30068-Pelagococcus_subviridis.AAC.3